MRTNKNIQRIGAMVIVMSVLASNTTYAIVGVSNAGSGIKTIGGTVGGSATPNTGNTVYAPNSSKIPGADSADPTSNGGLGGYSNSGGTGGGVGSACTSNLISTAVISGTIALLTGVEAFTSVPSTSVGNNIGQSFDSGTNWFDFLKVNCLDPAARALYKKMLLQTNQSILNWVNNGFKGGPLDGATFPTDLESYFGSIKDSTTETWLSDQDKTNPFFEEIAKATYSAARTDSKAAYTPDLAESILQAGCDSYQQNQTAGNAASSNSNNTSIFNSLSNTLRGLLNGNTNVDRTAPEYRSGDIIKQSGGINDLGAFNFNPLRTEKAFAFTEQAALEAAAAGKGPKLDQMAAGLNNPCNRRATTAQEKRDIIQAYNSGQIQVNPQYKWDILQKSFECKNRVDCAVLTAINSKETTVQNAQDTEKTNLANNNGNTGQRVCVSYLPRSPEDQANNVARSCRADGWQIVTPGGVLASRLNDTLQSGVENINKLTTTGTFQDLAQSLLTNLINGLTNQLINSANGLLSFNKNSNKTSQGEFTQGVTNLVNQATNSTDINSSISKTAAYITVLKNNRDTASELVSTVSDVQGLCSDILNQLSTVSAGGAFTGTNTNILNHRCNIDPYKQNYKDDPTAGARLASNPIYSEVGQLDGIKSLRDQLTVSLTNAQSTLTGLRDAQAEYTASQDVNRETTFSQKIGVLTSGIPQDESVTVAQSQGASLNSRLQTMSSIKTELQNELASLKN